MLAFSLALYTNVYYNVHVTSFPPSIMGIDIRARWKNQSVLEEKMQITGYRIDKGNVGYLREAYHGGPYVTQYLLSESFASGLEGDDLEYGPRIPSDVLRSRLPAAVLLALYRNHIVYENKKNPACIQLGDAGKALLNIFMKEMKDKSAEEIVAKFTPENILMAEELVSKKMLPDYAQSFVDFVEICEQKEEKTGEPCRIYASY